MIKKFSKDLSAGTIQVVLNQLAGLFVFIIISRSLDKPGYGELNWSLAFLVFLTSIMSMRLEQVVVKRIAAGENPADIFTLFSGHILITGSLLYIFLIGSSFIFPSFFEKHYLLLILAISQLLIFFASPFRQLANGRELFGYLAIISVTANVVRVLLLLGVLMFSSLDIKKVCFIYIFSSLAELLVSIYLSKFRMKIAPGKKWNFSNYFLLINESLPQIWAAILYASIARIDWILLGLLTTQAVTAEYSFAYKVFELSPIPLLVLSPILLSRFSRFFNRFPENSLIEKQQELSLFIRFEMILATFLPLILNILWAPVIDSITNNKYGSVNKNIFFILSLCIPFQYMTNLLWTINFTQNRLRLIFRITAITCLLIIAGDLVMIPYLNGTGAAFAFLFATVIEYLLYLNKSVLKNMKALWLPLISCMIAAVVSGMVVEFTAIPVIYKVIIAASLYIILLLVAKQIAKRDFSLIRRMVSEQGGGSSEQ